MGRPERFIPENKNGVLVEVTGRTIDGQALLVPKPNPRLFNETVVGVIGRGLEVSPIEICGLVFTANHFHFLGVVNDQQELSRFMHHVAGNLTKEVNRIRERTGPMWSRRYTGIVVSDEPEVQWARLRYLLSHGVKEGLCESPLDWPGVHAARALVHGEKLDGYWFNRTKEWAARNRKQKYEPYDFATRYRVELSPLPAFRDLTPEEYQAKVAEMVIDIEANGKKKRDTRPVAGVEKILRQNPYKRPTRKRPKREPRPQFHVKEREPKKALWDEFRVFLTQYRYASERLQVAGPRPGSSFGFPEGSYPTAMRFVGNPPPPRPPAPPTRRIEFPESEGVVRGQAQQVIRGPIPEVEVPMRIRTEPRSRGHPL